MAAQKIDTRVRILEAARKLLVERGFHGVGLEDIAAAAGVSRQAVYKSHFASKSELLLQLVRYVHEADKFDELTQPIGDAKTALEALEATIRAIVGIQTRVHDLSLLLSAAAQSDPDAAVAWQDRMEVKRGGIRAALERLDREQRLSPSWKLEQAVDILAALLSVDAYQQLVIEHRWKPEAVVQRVRELCAAFLVEPKPTRRPRR